MLWISRLLSDAYQQPSLMRFVVLIITLSSIGMGIYSIQKDSVIGKELAITFLGIGVAGKGLQKIPETVREIKDTR